jgi:hypothetical protein
MAAGLGFKDFVTGEVLTAADVDGYLMQGVWVFASAAARDAAVTSPQEGNFAYLKDTNVTTYYTGSAWANLDTTGMTNPMTTTGDTIYSSSGSTPARLGIGSTGQVLTVASGIPSWATPAGGASFAGVSIDNTTDAMSISNNTNTKITFDREVFDVGGYASSGSTITIPSGKAGYYRISAQTTFSDAASGYRAFRLYKNGAEQFGYNWYAGGSPFMPLDYTNYYAVSDTLEFYVQQNSGGSLNIYRNINSSAFFSVSYLGA